MQPEVLESAESEQMQVGELGRHVRIADSGGIVRRGKQIEERVPVFPLAQSEGG